MQTEISTLPAYNRHMGQPSERNTFTHIGSMLYILHNTQGSSDKYGACEVCGRFASSMFLQHTYEASEGLPAFGVGPYWAAVSIDKSGPHWGHKECLESIRRNA